MGIIEMTNTFSIVSTEEMKQELIQEGFKHVTVQEMKFNEPIFLMNALQRCLQEQKGFIVYMAKENTPHLFDKCTFAVAKYNSIVGTNQSDGILLKENQNEFNLYITCKGAEKMIKQVQKRLPLFADCQFMKL